MGVVTQARKTIGTTPTIIYDNTALGATGQVRLKIKNKAAAVAVFVGGSNVATTTGYEIIANDRETFELNPGDILYGIVAAATEVVHTLIQRY